MTITPEELKQWRADSEELSQGPLWSGVPIHDRILRLLDALEAADARAVKAIEHAELSTDAIRANNMWFKEYNIVKAERDVLANRLVYLEDYPPGGALLDDWELSKAAWIAWAREEAAKSAS